MGKNCVKVSQFEVGYLKKRIVTNSIFRINHKDTKIQEALREARVFDSQWKCVSILCHLCIYAIAGSILALECVLLLLMFRIYTTALPRFAE